MRVVWWSTTNVCMVMCVASQRYAITVSNISLRYFFLLLFSSRLFVRSINRIEIPIYNLPSILGIFCVFVCILTLWNYRHPFHVMRRKVALCRTMVGNFHEYCRWNNRLDFPHFFVHWTIILNGCVVTWKYSRSRCRARCLSSFHQSNAWYHNGMRWQIKYFQMWFVASIFVPFFTLVAFKNDSQRK